MPPRRSNRKASTNNNNDIAGMIAQQLAGAIPNIVAQVTAAFQQQQPPPQQPPPQHHPPVNCGGNPPVGVNHNNNPGCTYKEFLACKPKEFDGKGGALVLNRWFEKTEAVIDISGCADQNKVRFASNSLTGKALTWWNSEIQARGREAAMGMTWNDFRALLLEEFCPRNEMQKLESEFWDHSMVGTNHAAYTDRFHELARLCPQMVTPESKRIERYIHGLHPEVRRVLTATEPVTIQSAIHKAGAVTDDLVRSEILTTDKRKEPSDSKQGSHKKSRYDSGKSEGSSRSGYAGNLPLCQNCSRHHSRDAPCTCTKCNRRGHAAKDCRVRAIAATPVNAVRPAGCFECGSMDHFIRDCPKRKGINGDRNNQPQIGNGNRNQGNQGNQTRGRAYLLAANDAQRDPNTVAGNEQT